MKPINSTLRIKNSLLLIVFSLFSTMLSAQTAPPIQWKKSFGGTKTDNAWAVDNTLDGGYIVAGGSYSSDNDVVGNHILAPYVPHDAWVIRLDSNGSVVWKKCYGAYGSEEFKDVIATADGGFFFIGETTSYQSGDVTGIFPDTCATCFNTNIWMVKTNASGTILWEKSIGGAGHDYVRSLVQTPDGGFAFIGYSNSTNGDLTGLKPEEKVWVVKMNDTGKILWQKIYGGSKIESPIDLKNTSDRGFVIASIADSDDGDVNDRQGGRDTWVLKLDSIGAMQWNKTYGGSKVDQGGGSIVESVDGGYLFVAHPQSSDGDISGNKGGSDIWMVRLDDTGKILWEKSFGGSGYDGFSKVIQTPDSGFVVAGFTASNDGDVTVNNGPSDWWIVKTNKNGVKNWQLSIGSTFNERPYDIVLAKDGYFITGGSSGNTGDMLNTGFKGASDYFFVKLKENFKPTTITKAIGDKAIKVYPSPTSGLVNIELSQGYENAELKVYDMMGKLLQVNIKQQGAVRTVDLSQFASGTYMIQVIYGEQASSYKVLKQ
ncbi:MAG: T9SS type A sorting domain-containing protein [Flavipsychrobacter sp.]